MFWFAHGFRIHSHVSVRLSELALETCEHFEFDEQHFQKDRIIHICTFVSNAYCYSVSSSVLRGIFGPFRSSLASSFTCFRYHMCFFLMSCLIDFVLDVDRARVCNLGQDPHLAFCFCDVDFRIVFVSFWYHLDIILG